jgi:hypothetical protein
LMREFTMSGGPKSGPIGGGFLTTAIPGKERVDEPADMRERGRGEPIMAKGHLPAFPADVETQDVELTLGQRRIDEAGAKQELAVIAQAQPGLLQDQILDDVGLESAKPQAGLTVQDNAMELRPLLGGDEDGVATGSGGADGEPEGRDDRGRQAGADRTGQLRFRAKHQQDGEDDAETTEEAKRLSEPLVPMTKTRQR